MTLVIQVLILFVFINTILKLSFWRWWQAALFALVGAVFTICICPYTASQSKTQLAELMSSNQVMQDLAVLVTLESALYIAYCLVGLKEIFGKKVTCWGSFLFFYPGLLIFPSLFYLQALTIFSMPGTDFDSVAYVIAGGVLLLLPLLSYGVRHLFPEKDLRLEVHFLVSLFICVIGLICTADGKVTYAAANNPMNWKAFALAAGLFIVLFLAGYIIYKVKWTFQKKMKNKINLKKKNE